MAETGKDTGLVGKLKSLIPGRKPQVTVVVPPAVATAQPKENTPRALSPFEQIQQLLEREAEVRDPNQFSRRIKLEKKVHNARSGHKDPAYITIEQQRRIGAVNWGSISVSIFVATDDDLRREYTEHNLHGLSVGKPRQGSLVMSPQEPKLTLDVANSREGSDDIWGILGLSRPINKGDTKIWSGGSMGISRTSPCTTNNAQELGKVVSFIKDGSAVISKR